MKKDLTNFLVAREITDASGVVAWGASPSVVSEQHDVRKRVEPISTERVTKREVERLKKRVRELAAELIAAREATRLFLARELHDGVGAELTAARFALLNVQTHLPSDVDAKCVAALSVAQRSLDATCEASCRVVEALHTPDLHNGLAYALSQWIDVFSTRTGLQIGLICPADARLAQLSYHAAIAIFRVVQEALNNVAKHARASCVEVRLKADCRLLTLTIKDDGCGLVHRRACDARRVFAAGGFGLAGMRARCEAFGGTLRITSCVRRASHCALRTLGSKSPPCAKAGTTVRARFLWAALLDAPIKRHQALPL